MSFARTIESSNVGKSSLPVYLGGDRCRFVFLFKEKNKMYMQPYRFICMEDSLRSLADDPLRGYEKRYTKTIREKEHKRVKISRNNKKGAWFPFSIIFLKATVLER
jgi:hypothetical protein